MAKTFPELSFIPINSISGPERQRPVTAEVVFPDADFAFDFTVLGVGIVVVVFAVVLIEVLVIVVIVFGGVVVLDKEFLVIVVDIIIVLSEDNIFLFGVDVINVVVDAGSAGSNEVIVVTVVESVFLAPRYPSDGKIPQHW